MPAGNNRQLWFTPHFFRFPDEARRFLALQPQNQAQIGLFVDLTRVGSSTYQLELQRTAAMYGHPGGGLELVLTNYQAADLPLQAIPQHFRLSAVDATVVLFEVP
jgi:hypothetical protein